MEYDVIGDIHGHADKLDALLKRLGYAQIEGRWVPPAGRKAIFLGDLIDRGPKQLQVLQTVRSMVDAGDAHCLMGNHELNAIAWVTENREKPGAYLRDRANPSKLGHHIEFLRQVGEDSPLHLEWVNWMRSLPLYLDLGCIRVVHAWWHQPHVDLIASHWQQGEPISDDFLHAALKKHSPEWRAVEGLCKGQELRLPEGYRYLDHAGIPRKNVRTRWWLGGEVNYREVAIVPDHAVQDMPPEPVPDHYVGGEPEGAPVFVGHYWFQGEPKVLSRKVACLDWSVAGKGPAVAYRWQGESELVDDHFVMAGAEY
jgi:Calcineurin-like phosphoesterase